MRKSLDEDVFLFSALKTHAQLFEASRLLTKPDGTLRSAYEFEQAVLQIKETYNVNYLDAERQFAITAAQQAANWVEIEKDGERYFIQYRTAADDRVRESHEKLNGITLPFTDGFWLEFYPPNGWRCRCVAIQVNKDKYSISDSREAVEAGMVATTQIGKNGKNKLAIFRFNPGKQKIIFPPNHPYSKLPGAAYIKSSMKQNTTTQETLKSTADLNSFFHDFAQQFPDYFARGFRELNISTKQGANGYTDMYGRIWLRSDRMKLTKEGLNAIRKGIATTYEQEDALSTLHHEIWHNAHKLRLLSMSKTQTRFMELANEFVSRSTLPEFMEKLGGQLHHTQLITDRPSTGYNAMVKNYEYLIGWTKADKSVVLEEVKKYLVNESYLTQLDGLANAIVKGSEFKLKSKDMKVLIRIAEGSYNVQSFEKALARYEQLLIKK